MFLVLQRKMYNHNRALRCVGYFADDFYEYIYRVDFQRGLFVDSRFIFVWNHQFGFLGLYGKAD